MQFFQYGHVPLFLLQQGYGRGGLDPAAEQASVVLDVLRLQLQKEQVELLTGEKVKEVRADGKGIEVILEKGSRFFQGVIIACGGRAAPQTRKPWDIPWCPWYRRWYS